MSEQHATCAGCKAKFGTCSGSAYFTCTSYQLGGKLCCKQMIFQRSWKTDMSSTGLFAHTCHFPLLSSSLSDRLPPSYHLNNRTTYNRQQADRYLEDIVQTSLLTLTSVIMTQYKVTFFSVPFGHPCSKTCLHSLTQ